MAARGPVLRITEPILEGEAHPLFRGVEPEAAARALQRGVRRGYRRGMFLFVEGEPVEAFYCLLAGRVKLYTEAGDGRQQILGIFGAGHLLPHTAALEPGVHGATAEVVRDTVAIRYTSECFTELLNENPAMTRNWAGLLERRVQSLQDIIRNLSLYSVPQRLARVLARQAEEEGIAADGGYLFRFTWTQNDLAQFVGTSRETVSRALAEMRRSGALRPGGKGMVFLDLKKLNEYL